MGAGGWKFQWIIATPGSCAQNDILAARKSPFPPGYGGLFSAPVATEMVPGSTCTLRNVHCAGPLHTSFCSTASQGVVGTCTDSDIVQSGPLPVTLSINELATV